MSTYIVRHGQTVKNLANVIQGQEDSDLTELGRRQADNIRTVFTSVRLDWIVSSDLRRALQTCAGVAENHGLEIQEEPLLREQHWGEYQGKRMEDVLPEYFNVGHELFIDPPGGESLEELAARARAFWSSYSPRFEGRNTLLVSHGTFIQVLLLVIEDDSSRLRSHRETIPNGSIAVVERNTKPGHPQWSVTANVDYQHFVTDRIAND